LYRDRLIRLLVDLFARIDPSTVVSIETPEPCRTTAGVVIVVVVIVISILGIVDDSSSPLRRPVQWVGWSGTGQDWGE
jgi:quinol-cytochrome oxidoreductase complex cytochrome b subunit